MNVALYARVSTTDQQCEMQLAEMRTYVKARGWKIYKEYVDTGFSGKDKERPEVKKCMADARKRAIDCIMVWKLDRWGRTVNQLSTDILDFDSMGIRFIAITQNIDTDKSNPMSRLVLHIMAAIAEFEREVILERVKAGLEHAKLHGTKSGKDIGRPRKIFDREGMKKMRAEGASLAQVANKYGITKTTVRRLCEVSFNLV